jgi:hypothetical protein
MSAVRLTPATFDIDMLPGSSNLTVLEAAAIIRRTPGALEQWRRDPNHPLKWRYVDGRPLYRVDAVRDYLAGRDKTAPFLRCRIQSYDELIVFIPFWPRLSMMLGMINASGICPLGNSTKACAAARVQSSPAKHCSRRRACLVAANMGDMR